jgi:hypothetical protein
MDCSEAYISGWIPAKLSAQQLIALVNFNPKD